MTTTNVSHDIDTSAILAELHATESMAPTAATSAQAPRKNNKPRLTENQLRKNAQIERERGVERLAVRHNGVMSMLQTVDLNERVVGSTFERYFASIENGIHFITSHAENILGANDAYIAIQGMTAQIETLKERTDKALKDIQVELAVHKESPDFMIPTYTQPAASHEVQIRSRMAMDLLSCLKKQDEIVSAQQMLLWNGAVETSTIDNQEMAIKRSFRDLERYVTRVLQGLQKRSSDKRRLAQAAVQQANTTPAKPTVAAPTPETSEQAA